MKPVDQDRFGAGTGNCFSACVASILELPLSEVPFFMSPEDWWPPFVEWCAARGWEAAFHYGTEYKPLGYSIAGGLSPRFEGCGHACVALDGNVVHDPHPDRLGLPSIEDYITLTPRTEAVK